MLIRIESMDRYKVTRSTSTLTTENSIESDERLSICALVECAWVRVCVCCFSAIALGIYIYVNYDLRGT